MADDSRAPLSGRCLCGAVQIEIGAHRPAASACHCTMCRRWSGAAFWGFDADAGEVAVSGPVKTYDSSEFAERAFCATCGTHLWFRDHGADYEFVPGIFDGAADFPLEREVYADRAFAAVPLAGDHARVTAADYESRNRFVEGDG